MRWTRSPQKSWNDIGCQSWYDPVWKAGNDTLTYEDKWILAGQQCLSSYPCLNSVVNSFAVGYGRRDGRASISVLGLQFRYPDRRSRFPIGSRSGSDSSRRDHMSVAFRPHVALSLINAKHVIAISSYSHSRSLKLLMWRMPSYWPDPTFANLKQPLALIDTPEMGNFINSRKVEMKMVISSPVSGLLKVQFSLYLKVHQKSLLSKSLSVTLKTRLSWTRYFRHWSGNCRTNGKKPAALKVVLSSSVKGARKVPLSVSLSGIRKLALYGAAEIGHDIPTFSSTFLQLIIFSLSGVMANGRPAACSLNPTRHVVASLRPLESQSKKRDRLNISQ